MSNLIIMRPLSQPVAAFTSTPTAGMDRMLTPDPKEAFSFTPGSTTSLVLDFGVPVTADSFYVGFVGNVSAASSWQVVTATNFAITTGVAVVVNSAFSAVNSEYPGHFFVKVAAPVTSRYWRFSVGSNEAAAFTGGVFSMGNTLQLTFGQEFGEGRLIEDTSTIERLPSGGFGIDAGAITTGWSWTLGDIQPSELLILYAIARNRGLSKSLLVIEDPDNTVGLNERFHWGLFRKLSQYERIDPLNTKWDLSIWDWS